ncbi:MAG: T9SS type A sorting domain-containing protein [Bacteroidota bacterium]
MPYTTKWTLFFLVVLTSSSFLNGQVAQVEMVRHACGGNNGAIQIALTDNNDIDDYYYVWTHSGNTELFANNLGPGLYTFYIESPFGCKEELEVEILDFSGCNSTYCSRYVEDECKYVVGVNIFNGDGDFIDPEYVDIRWNINNQTGRFIDVGIDKGETVDVCYTYGIINGDGENCCSEEKCFELKKPVDAADCNNNLNCQLVINEVYIDKSSSFLELLVVGDGSACDKGCDLRNMILDDNNGSLIVDHYPLDSLLSSSIDLGYLRFKNVESWASIPTGSLIVIYENNNHPQVVEDATDQDGDGVYFVWGENDSFLCGFSSNPSGALESYGYDGFPTSPKWDLINLDKGYDGLQTRNSGATSITHALAIGHSEIQGINGGSAIPIEYAEGELASLSLRLTSYDFNSSASFTVVVNENNGVTPGEPNSVENEVYIQELTDCKNTLKPSIETLKQHTGKEFNFKLKPNPNVDQASINIQSSLSGLVDVRIIDATGKRVYQRKVMIDVGSSVISIESSFFQRPSGVYFLQLTTPDGFKYIEKFIKIHKAI